MRTQIGAVALLLAGCAGGAETGSALRVSVESGVVEGASEGGVRVWRNIPYAKAPVGELRWKAPEAAETWEGVRQATANGPSCPQTMPAHGGPNGGGAYGPMSEDCLHVNVWAPADAKDAPVMVWIHGGSHRTGAGWVYDGSSFAREGVVLVTINYRLGPLGYLSHPALGTRSGNYGLMDQVAALQWVQRNIGAFGGNKDNVTLFGESAGGLSTMAVLSVPSANGLYDRAIVQSGGGWYPPVTLAQREEQGAKIFAGAGAPANATAAELRAIPAERLIAAATGDFGPYPDGQLMPATPSQMIARGQFPDVPLIIGWVSGEDSLMGPSPLPPATLALIPPVARMVYREEAAQGDEALARVIFTDSLFGAPARWVAAQTAEGAPSWLYHFSYVGEAYRAQRTSAGHATEIPYMFRMKESPVGNLGPGDMAVADLMHGCWVAFAKTGAPCAQWPAYDASTDQLMEFSADSGVRTGFKKAAFTAQETVGLAALKLGE
jgi:para-nitrobenzyl esterase